MLKLGLPSLVYFLLTIASHAYRSCSVFPKLLLNFMLRSILFGIHKHSKVFLVPG